ncbi:hypothetical protein, partial [Proteus mirabilis]|uniref:hypothetical protein n=1 Tax=Proteus mirabilis TaxID=584 RepID=UPI001C1312D7
LNKPFHPTILHKQSYLISLEMEGTSVRHFKTICVFCGASKGKDKEFLRAANNLGHVFVCKKY